MKVTILDKRVEKELNALSNGSKANFAHIVNLMKIHGTYALGLPHVRKLNKELWEIRIKDKDGIARAVFIAVSNEIIVLHAFVKKTQKTPKQNIDLAIKRMKEI